jgi:hypothetical protein
MKKSCITMRTPQFSTQLSAGNRRDEGTGGDMPAKKKIAKPKLKLVKSKVQPKAKKSQIEKKHATAKPKLAAKKTKAKAHKPVPQASGGSIFWKVLEMRRREREQRQEQQHAHDGKDNRHLYSDKHSKFGRFAGPRRKAA